MIQQVSPGGACHQFDESFSSLIFCQVQTDYRLQTEIDAKCTGGLNKKGTRPVLILATQRHTTESVDWFARLTLKKSTGLRHVSI